MSASATNPAVQQPDTNPLEQPDPLALSMSAQQPKARPTIAPATPTTTAPALPVSGLSGMPGLQPPAHAPDTGLPVSGLGTTAASAPPAASPATPTSATSAPGAVSLAPTDPNNPLTAQTISAGPTADRFGIANNQLQNTIQNILNPQFAADQRTLAQNAAARGQVGSGMFRTSLGNLDLARQQDLDSTASNFLNNALTGSINDAYQNVGIAQQQQGFQNQQQQEAFGNSLQQLLAGSEGDPASLQLALSQLYGGQAASAGQAAASAAGAKTAQNASSGQLNQILGILQGTTPTIGAPSTGPTGGAGTDPFTLPPNFGLPTVGTASGGSALPYASAYSSYDPSYYGY